MILLYIFKNGRITGLVAIVFLCLGFLIPGLIHPLPYESLPGMPLYQLLFGGIAKHPILDGIMASLVFLLLAYLLVRIGVRFLLLENRSVMPAIFFLLFAAILPNAMRMSPPLLASLFYLISLSMVFNLHDKRDAFGVFNASLVLSFGAMFYLPLLWFIPLFWFAILTMRNASWREFLHTLVAPGLAFFFLFTWYWAIQNEADGFTMLIQSQFSFPEWQMDWHFSSFIFYGLFLLLVGLASLYMVKRFQARKTMVQNIYQVMFYMFIGGLIFFVLVSRLDPAALVYPAFPTAYILSNYFHRRKNHWGLELALWLLLGAGVYLQLAG